MVMDDRPGFRDSECRHVPKSMDGRQMDLDLASYGKRIQRLARLAPRLVWQAGIAESDTELIFDRGV